MTTHYGLLVVTADTIFAELEQRGIRAWLQRRPPLDLAKYATGDLTDAQQNELERFAPQAQATFLTTPQGEHYTGFRTVGKNWATVFSLIPNPSEQNDPLVPIVGEWKHGAEVMTLSPPAGVPGKEDARFLRPMEQCAQREFEEETGLTLLNLTALSDCGIPVSGRQSTPLFFPFLGKVKEPIQPKQYKLDGTEHLQPMLIPLSEWLQLIELGKVLEASAIVVTYMALRRLGWLRLVPPTE